MSEQEARAGVRNYLIGKSNEEANKWCDMRIDEGSWLAVAKAIGLERPHPAAGDVRGGQA